MLRFFVVFYVLLSTSFFSVGFAKQRCADAFAIIIQKNFVNALEHLGIPRAKESFLLSGPQKDLHRSLLQTVEEINNPEIIDQISYAFRTYTYEDALAIGSKNSAAEWDRAYAQSESLGLAHLRTTENEDVATAIYGALLDRQLLSAQTRPLVSVLLSFTVDQSVFSPLAPPEITMREAGRTTALQSVDDKLYPKVRAFLNKGLKVPSFKNRLHHVVVDTLQVVLRSPLTEDIQRKQTSLVRVGTWLEKKSPVLSMSEQHKVDASQLMSIIVNMIMRDLNLADRGLLPDHHLIQDQIEAFEKIADTSFIKAEFLERVEGVLVETLGLGRSNYHIAHEGLLAFEYIMYGTAYPLDTTHLQKIILRPVTKELKRAAKTAHFSSEPRGQSAAIFQNGGRSEPKSPGTQGVQRKKVSRRTRPKIKTRGKPGTRSTTPSPDVLVKKQTPVLLAEIGDIRANQEYLFEFQREDGPQQYQLVVDEKVIEEARVRGRNIKPFLRSINYGMTSGQMENGIKKLNSLSGSGQTVYEVKPGRSDYRVLMTRTGNRWQAHKFVHKDKVPLEIPNIP